MVAVARSRATAATVQPAKGSLGEALVEGWAWPQGAALAWLVAGALAGGLARGFSGFGAALIFVPLAAAALGPRMAPPLMLLLEVVAVLSLVRNAWRQAPRREVGLLSAGLVLGTPLGVLLLANADALALRWGICGFIILLVGFLATGWQLRQGEGRALPIGFGVLGGLLGGAANLSGPPALVYLLSRDLPKQQVRAAFNLYFAAGGALAGLGYILAGLLTPALIGPALVAGPLYGLGILLGSRMFGLASEAVFRRACHAMIAAAALLSLPLWDGILR